MGTCPAWCPQDVPPPGRAAPRHVSSAYMVNLLDVYNLLIPLFFVDLRKTFYSFFLYIFYLFLALFFIPFFFHFHVFLAVSTGKRGEAN